ncbi:MAG: hypothetical protein WD049_04720 [Candidatus Paceibacterota bacterium]
MDSLIAVVRDVVTKIISFPADVLALAVLVIVLFTIALSVGQKKYTTALFSFYPALVAYTFLPAALLEAILVADSPWMILVTKLGLFTVFGIGTFIVLKKYTKKRASESGKKDTMFAFFLALGAAALTLSLVVVVIPISEVYSLSPLITDLVTPSTVVWWMIAPLAILYIFRRD